MATTTQTTTNSLPSGAGGPQQLVTQMLNHTAPHYTFSFTPFLQRTYQHSLPADRPICKAYASGNCPLKSHCPERHVTTSSQNTHGGGNTFSGGFGSLVCKHWLRGLCKKGESCEFLHEYNLRKMPECNFFVRNGYCSNGDECLYLHIDPLSRLPPCPHYERGFCPLGPRCDKKHFRRKLCLYYLAGFCPDGKGCKEGAHPRWTADKDMEKPRAKGEGDQMLLQQQQQQQQQQHMGDANGMGGGMAQATGANEYMDRERERDRDNREREMMMQGRDRDGGGHDRHKDRFGGGGGGGGGGRGRGGWRGRGRGGFRGKGH
ncbi:hypothetical protein NEUTE1DRAFT_125898 [Neurospora tetrasperma FGSC 2508]|uniref:mRNA 3'-end-processing protein n=1 Tax=Neurospora tetrasperma (strain FGSC 2508 / ATCC MYA-4615 / P0657) TaxID=510951 RepID=F8N1X4_NEUT8|nr:uncharacterized protein NEUTE1DRAFT_125898 [Neurospora tetrasperma FGSC 2508]EGO52401.1 hypothetical protein NEUTE1DRAFT_125898 [Neurospora tetrasperma FGSC 2508]